MIMSQMVRPVSRERKRERDRQTDRDRDRQTNRDRDRDKPNKDTKNKPLDEHTGQDEEIGQVTDKQTHTQINRDENITLVIRLR